MPDGDETTGTEGVQGGQPQGDAVTNTDAVQGQQAEQSAPQGVSGPWADKLESRFDDPAIRAQVDEFLKADVQPYVTQLEQSRSDVPEEAGLLYNDLLENPAETYLAITHELYGPEAAQAVQRALDQGATPEQAAAVGQQVAEEGEVDDEGDPVLERMREDYIERQQAEAYTEALNAVKDQLPEGEELIEDLFHPFVVSTNGDFDAALEGYRSFVKEAKEKFGLSPDQIPDSIEPPPTLGSDSQTTTAPPTQKKYESIDEALDDTLAEIRANKAPATVGVV